MQSTSITISAKRLPHAENLPIPVRMTIGSSGYDVCAAIDDGGAIVILPLSRAVIPTGFCFDIPNGFEIQIRPRSGLALKHGITVLNSPGTIDADYRGEVKIILINLGDRPFVINRGDRIAQLVPARVANDVSFIEATDLSKTIRGNGGFGHSG